MPDLLSAMLGKSLLGHDSFFATGQINGYSPWTHTGLFSIQGNAG